MIDLDGIIVSAIFLQIVEWFNRRVDETLPRIVFPTAGAYSVRMVIHLEDNKDNQVASKVDLLIKTSGVLSRTIFAEMQFSPTYFARLERLEPELQTLAAWLPRPK